MHDDMLVVADAWHHRILIYGRLPTSGNVEPDLILGQQDPDSVQPNRGKDCSAESLYWPFGIAVVDGRFYVADTGNRGVLGWFGGIPTSPTVEPDLVLGQPDAFHREENRDGPAGPRSFRWPHDICGTSEKMLVADASNNRVLGWQPHPTADRPADLLLGQSDFTKSTELPFGPQRADLMRFTYAVGKRRRRGGRCGHRQQSNSVVGQLAGGRWTTRLGARSIRCRTRSSASRISPGRREPLVEGHRRFTVLVERAVALRGPANHRRFWQQPDRGLGTGKIVASYVWEFRDGSWIFDEGGALMALADFDGEQRRICLAYLPDLAVGEFIIAHIGSALTRIDEQNPSSTLDLMREYGGLDTPASLPCIFMTVHP